MNNVRCAFGAKAIVHCSFLIVHAFRFSFLAYLFCSTVNKSRQSAILMSGKIFLAGDKSVCIFAVPFAEKRRKID
jgi:hypothetical protein